LGIWTGADAVGENEVDVIPGYVGDLSELEIDVIED
jgi:hypothetical protein